jgi:Peptidase A4 family
VTHELRTSGPPGNERLTTTVGLVLLVLLVVETLTTLSARSLLPVHIFLGLLLLPPLALKLASVGWRFFRYYRRNEPYRLEGPPRLLLRLLAPLLVASTLVVFGSGIALAIVGHGGALFTVHVLSFGVWGLLIIVHVLAYFARTLRVGTADWRRRADVVVAGARSRRAALSGAVLAGVILALATYPAQQRWLSHRREHQHAAGLAHAPAAVVVRHDVVSATSSNWAGYAVSAANGSPAASFSSVSDAWRQPAATCTVGTPTYSAFWVGLGGFSATSEALEQVGTQANCSASGRVTYSVWYELVPAAPVTIKLPIKAGDGIAASVAVSKTGVTIRITNVTQKKKTFTKRLIMASPTPDVSSAEWVAEAPSACTPTARCTVLPLANFGGVTFVVTKATADGHAGTISDPAWSATAITLGDPGSGATDATPAPLSADGSSFGVTWSAPQPAP